jgi:AhpC/TSA family
VHTSKQTEDRTSRDQPQSVHGEHCSDLDPALLNFDQTCATCQRIQRSSVRLRVPSVLFFVGTQCPDADVILRELDAAHHEFVQRNVQLVVLVEEKPSQASSRLGLSVPIMEDNGLGALFLAKPHGQRCRAAVILANDGRALGVLQSFPATHPALPILGRIDRLRARLPNLFCSGHVSRT